MRLGGIDCRVSSVLETLQSEGIGAANMVDKNMVVKKKDGKDVEVQDGWVGRIIPIPLVEKILLSDELAADISHDGYL